MNLKVSWDKLQWPRVPELDKQLRKWLNGWMDSINLSNVC